MTEECRQSRPEVEAEALRILDVGLLVILSSKDCGYPLNPSTSERDDV